MELIFFSLETAGQRWLEGNTKKTRVGGLPPTTAACKKVSAVIRVQTRTYGLNTTLSGGRQTAAVGIVGKSQNGRSEIIGFYFRSLFFVLLSRRWIRRSDNDGPGGPLRAASVSELLRARHGGYSFRLPCARGRFTRLNRVLWRTRRRSALPDRPSTAWRVILLHVTIRNDRFYEPARGGPVRRSNRYTHATDVERRRSESGAATRDDARTSRVQTQEFFYLEPTGRPPPPPTPLAPHTLEWNRRNRSVSSRYGRRLRPGSEKSTDVRLSQHRYFIDNNNTCILSSATCPPHLTSTRRSRRTMVAGERSVGGRAIKAFDFFFLLSRAASTMSEPCLAQVAPTARRNFDTPGSTFFVAGGMFRRTGLRKYLSLLKKKKNDERQNKKCLTMLT